MVTYRDILNTLSDDDLSELFTKDYIINMACRDIECFKHMNCVKSDKCISCIKSFLKENVEIQ